MSIVNIQTGKQGEQIAQTFLRSLGYKILDSNVRTPLGEIDIIAKKKEVIHFVEVKTRKSLEKGLPHESVTFIKQLHMKRAVEYYCLINKLNTCKLSMSVISIILENPNKPVIKQYEMNL